MSTILSLLRVPAFFAALALAQTSTAQTAGPNSPATAGNNAGVGTMAWANPGNSMITDDAYATMGTKGTSQYLTTNTYGFSIPVATGISGIQLDVERSTLGSSDVVLLDGWSTGLTKSVSAGTNRCLLVAYAQENGIDSRDITAMTYGGRPMTQVAERTAGTVAGFVARVEVWMLLEADIALAGSTTIVPTYGAYTSLEYCEAFSAASFQHVDQLTPMTALQTSGAVASTNPHQLSAAIATIAGGMVVNAVTEGNNTTPASVDGATGTYTINSGYTEGTDLYFANTGVAPTSGACLQTAHKAIAANGTEQPACTFAGSVNRWAMIGFTLQRARELDHRVHLIKGGTIGGSDLSSATAWPTADAYVTYGGTLSLWGRTWAAGDINSATFGAALAARVQNGTARVDHMRITVYYYSTLPVELLGFSATPKDNGVQLDWATASELNNDHFKVQRSRDGVTFEDIVHVPGAGNSQVTLFYAAADGHPFPGTSYYRLKQVDTDGTNELSPAVAVTVGGGQLSVYPNPTCDGILTVYDPAAQHLAVAVYDNEMRLVRQSAVNSGDPMQLLGDLPDGTYIIRASNGAEVRSSKVVKTSRTR